MAIADLVHSDVHAFSLPKYKGFRTVLRLAKTVGPDFKVPGRNRISGILLYRNFKSCWEANRDTFLLNSSIFGLGFLGDGATIAHTPFINILRMCCDTPPIVIGIHDCTNHLIECGKKDAPYISDLFRTQSSICVLNNYPHTEDPHTDDPHTDLPHTDNPHTS